MNRIMNQSEDIKPATAARAVWDVAVIGAGLAGLYMTYVARQLGLSVICFEAGSDVGGTWYWNRYPGARCDIESLDYSYSFSEELQSEWRWSEKFATQPEILRYISHVADRFDLRRDIQFNTRVRSAWYDESNQDWALTTSRGTNVRARYCILATGCLSSATVPDIAGLEDFAGAKYHTGSWPANGVDFSDRRVAVVGTGSSGIQCIPVISEQARQLTVFQRTANYSLPACNSTLSAEYVGQRIANYPAYREQARWSHTGVPVDEPTQSALEVSESVRQDRYEEAWQSGKYGALLRTFTDLMVNADANATAAEFVRRKIRDAVDDPRAAEVLAPKHAIGTKRTCLDTGYYQTFNRSNVALVDLRTEPIQRITHSGIETSVGNYAVDDIVFATGFDAMTGAIDRIDVRGRRGQQLREKWAEGPRTYLGLATAGFPNLFFITGPGSPSVLSNMVVSIEHHVEWIGRCLAHMKATGNDEIEPVVEAEEDWGRRVNAAAEATLYTTTDSWYLGANIPGKPRVFMPFVGGVGTYRALCAESEANGYTGFVIRRSHVRALAPATDDAVSHLKEGSSHEE